MSYKQEALKNFKASKQKCVASELHLQDEKKCITNIFNYQSRKGLFTLKSSMAGPKPQPFYKLIVMLRNFITYAVMANTSISKHSYI